MIPIRLLSFNYTMSNNSQSNNNINCFKAKMIRNCVLCNAQELNLKTINIRFWDSCKRKSGKYSLIKNSNYE